MSVCETILHTYLLYAYTCINILASKFKLHAQLHSAKIRMSPHLQSCMLNDLHFDASFGYGQQRCTKESTKTSSCKILDCSFLPTRSLHKHD